MNKINSNYKNQVLEIIASEFKEKNALARPRLTKIVLNVGLKEALADKKVIEEVVGEIGQISGQKARVAKAKKAIAGFKLREGDPIGVSVTMRGQRMYDFFEKLIAIVLPRVRDFRGVSKKSFDGQGNYTLGMKEQIVFPEIDYAKINKIRGLELTICTNCKNNSDGERFLKALGMPFTK